MGKIVAGAIAAMAGFFMLTVLFGSWYSVDQGERAVVLQNGATIGEAGPGLNYKWPIIQSTVHISIQQHTVRWACEPDNRGGMRANCKEDDEPVMQSYSQDQQPADIRVSVNFHIPADKVQEVYTQFGSLENLQDRVLARKAPQAVKTVFGQFNAVSVIQERAKFNLQVLEAISEAVKGSPLVIDSVQVENINFSTAYEKSVEARMLAQVEVQKREQELAQKKIEAEITVVNAQATADSNLAVAKALAEATRITGDATAAAIKARAQALADNPLLVELTKAEKWNGALPTTVLPGNSIPFISAH